MTRRSFKMVILGLVGFTAFAALSYTVFNALVLLACKTFLYMLQEPVNALIIILNMMALGWMIQMLYTKYKK